MEEVVLSEADKKDVQQTFTAEELKKAVNEAVASALREVEANEEPEEEEVEEVEEVDLTALIKEEVDNALKNRKKRVPVAGEPKHDIQKESILNQLRGFGYTEPGAAEEAYEKYYINKDEI